MEDRLGDVTTTNTQEDDHLNDLEAEANLNGTITCRNRTDILQEKKKENTKNTRPARLAAINFATKTVLRFGVTRKVPTAVP